MSDTYNFWIIKFLFFSNLNEIVRIYRIDYSYFIQFVYRSV